MEDSEKIREQIRERWDKLGLMEDVSEIEFEDLTKLYQSLVKENEASDSDRLMSMYYKIFY